MEKTEATTGGEHLFPLNIRPTEHLARMFAPDRIAPWAKPGNKLVVPLESLASVPGPARVLPAQPPRSAPLSPMSMASTSSSAVFKPVHLAPEYVKAIHALVLAKQQQQQQPHGLDLLRATFSSAPSAQDLTLKWVCDRGLTLRDLASVAKVPITDLYKAGIARTFNDLLALGFRPSDLTVHRQCFNVNHLVSIFGTSYHQLRDCAACEGFSFSTLIHTVPRFTGDELQTLGVTAGDLLLEADGTFDARTDCAIVTVVGLSMEEWRDIGLSAEILVDRMKITPWLARTKLRWDPPKVAQVFALPPSWLQQAPSRTSST